MGLGGWNGMVSVYAEGCTSQMQGIPVSSGFCFSVVTFFAPSIRVTLLFKLWITTLLGVEQQFHMGSVKTIENRYLHCDS